MNDEQKGMLAAGTAYTIFGLSYLFSKMALNIAEPLILLCARFTVTFIVLNLLVLTGAMKLNLRGKSGDSASDVQKMRDLRNEISEACRVQARSEALREAVIQAVKELPALHAEPLPAHTQADRS